MCSSKLQAGILLTAGTAPKLAQRFLLPPLNPAEENSSSQLPNSRNNKQCRSISRILSVREMRRGSHVSGSFVASGLVRPTRECVPRGAGRGEQPRIPFGIPLLYGLAPGGVYRVSLQLRKGIPFRTLIIANEAVSPYLAFSPLFPPRGCTRGQKRYVFCDTIHTCRLSPADSALFARHPALWSSDFPHGTEVPRDCPTCSVK